MATKKTKTLMDSDVIAIAGKWPKVEIGTHLTVTKYEDGTTILKWDDEALLNEVKNAILKYESTIPVETEKPKSKSKGKTK